MRVWITRDRNEKSSNDGDIVVWGQKKKPDKQDDSGYDCSGGKVLYESYANKFKSIFGFTPRKGSVGQYELTLKEIVE